MTITACTHCGTQTQAGTACQQCGTPVPASPVASDAAGHMGYWLSIMEKLQQAMTPKYRVQGLLGYGGMAGVFAADEVRLGRRVAVKVMSPALMMDRQLVDRFIQEARTIALLTHPNIITIHEVDGRDDLHWFTMSYVPGRTLGQVMAEAAEPLSIPVIRAWLHQVGDALAYAHLHGVVHRDVKPGNVLLDQRGNAIVTDFGIAKVADNESGLTRTGMLVGTPAYMSPEQCSSGSVAGASDQYSLGAVVYHMLTGQVPFEGATLAVLQAHVSHEPVPVLGLRPDCPPRLAAAVHRMLAKRPEDRWPTMADALRASTAEPPGFDDPVRIRVEELATHAATIEASPPAGPLREGSRTRLDVVIRDAAGNVLGDRRINWVASDPAVAAVGEGAVWALSPGTAQLVGTCGSARTALTVGVEADAVQSVELALTQMSVAAGEQLPLQAVVRDLDGSTLEDRAVYWSSSNRAIADVSAAGLLTAVAPGECVIAARTGGVHATATITVLPSDAPTVLAVATARARRTTVPVNLAPDEAESATTTTATPAGTGAASRLSRTRLIAAGVVLTLLVAASFAVQMRFGPTAAPPDTMQSEVRASAPIPADPQAGSVAAPNADPVAPPPATGNAAATAPPVTAAIVPDTTPVIAPPQPVTTTSVPADGSLRVQGELPGDASVTARDQAGRIVALGARAVTLPPGTYLLQFSAPGYQRDERTLTLAAGEQQTWSPLVRAAPVPRDERAEQAQIQAAVRDFVDAFHRRDAATVLPLMPSDIRATWRQLLEDGRRVTDFAATLAEPSTPRIDGDNATVQFVVNLSFRNQNQVHRPVLRFVGRAQRATTGWRLLSLSTDGS